MFAFLYPATTLLEDPVSEIIMPCVIFSCIWVLVIACFYRFKLKFRTMIFLFILGCFIGLAALVIAVKYLPEVLLFLFGVRIY